VQQSYDAVGRPASVSSGTTTYLSGTTYNANFSLAGFAFGNGVTATYGYASDRLQTQSITYAKSGTTLFSQTYTFNQSGANNGHITAITDNVDSGRSMTYTYDSLERLTTALSQGSTNYPQWGLSWTFDRYGNRLSQAVTAGSGPTNSVAVNPATNQITTTGYAYDANGDTTNDGVNAVVYDAENRAVSAADGSGTASYSYNGSGLRVQKTFSGTTTVYVFSEGRVIAEYANGTLSEEYVYTNGGSLLAEYDNGFLTYHGRDYLSTRILMDANGNVAGQQGHYPFGEGWYTTTTKWHFTNYERDAESANDYAKFRYHANRLGRFLTVDPVRPSRPDPQLLNRYSYVASDPINRKDPNGLEACAPVDGITCVCCDPFWGCDSTYDGEECQAHCNDGPCGNDGGGLPPPPPPPPPLSQCFCQLKYRPVNDIPKKLHATHSFWYIQDISQQQRIISGFPSKPNGKGFLNDFINPNIYTGVDNVSATTWFNTVT